MEQDKSGLRNTLLNKLKVAKEEDQISPNSIKKNSEEWRFAEFHLKSMVPYECEIKKMQVIFNPHMKSNFEKVSKNKLTTYAWVNTKTLDSNNSISKIKSRGRFDIQIQGMDFLYGSIFETTNHVEIESTFILCKLMIGKTFCKIIKDKNELSSFILDYNQKSFLPDGYDSVMFNPINYFSSSYPSLNVNHKTIRYRIFDNGNVLPMYMVNFVPQAYHINTYISRKICEECSEKEAEFLCVQCNSNFCSDCNSNVHHEFSNDKKMVALYENHLLTKMPINKVTSGICGDCSLSKEVEFYCADCNKTICSFCKMVGNHSTGELATHELIDIIEHYQKLSPHKPESIKIFNDRIDKGQVMISKLKAQIHLLRENIYVEAQKQLEYETQIDYNHSQLITTDDLHLNINKLNMLNAFKDLIYTTNEYYALRQNLIKNVSMPEFVYIWFSYKRIVESFNANLEFFNTKNKYPEKQNYIVARFNEFKVNNYISDEQIINKEKSKEEVTKISSDLRKQMFDKNQMKLNISNTKLLKDMIKKHQKINALHNKSIPSINNDDGNMNDGKDEDL